MIDINNILEQKYFLLKDIVSKYNYDDSMHYMLTFIYTVFYLSYGNDSDLVMYDMLNNVQIIYGDDNIQNLARKNNFPDIDSNAAAVTLFFDDFFETGLTSKYKTPPKILLGTYVNDNEVTEILKLEMLIHELRHSFCAYYNTDYIIDDKLYYKRTGLKESYCELDDEIIFSKNEILDEVFNSYITQNLVNEILNFKNLNIKNDVFNIYLRKLNTNQKDGIYKTAGYTDMINLLYKLINNSQLCSLIDKCQFTGDIDQVKNYINNNCELSNYDDFSVLLDKTHLNIIKCRNMNNQTVSKELMDDIIILQKITNNIDENIKLKSKRLL